MKQILFLLSILISYNGNAQMFIDKSIPNLPGVRSLTSSVELRGLDKNKVKISVVYGTDSLEVLKAFNVDQRNPAKYYETTATIVSEANGKVEALAMLPHSGRTAGRRERIFPYGSKLFYAWVRTHTPAGASGELSINSSVKSFVMPRPMTIAYLGDSYASGEGAKGEGDWVNTACHRSNNSGGVLAINKLKSERKDIEFDYVNTTCSGARLLDFFAVAQPVSPGSMQTKQSKQVDLVAQWLSSKRYDGLDILLADGGGNDIGFGNIVEGGLLSFFKELRTDRVLLNSVNQNLRNLPSTYEMFMNYTDESINPQKVVWFNYPNPMTGTDKLLCKQDHFRAVNPLDCWGLLENQIATEDWQFMYDNVFLKLNSAVANAAKAHSWDVVDISKNALGKGLCNCEGYFNTIGQSILLQGDQFGTFHPNANGFRVIYRDAIYNSLTKNVDIILKDGKDNQKAIAMEKAKKKAKAAIASKKSQSNLLKVLDEQNKLTNRMKDLKIVKPIDSKKLIKKNDL